MQEFEFSIPQTVLFGSGSLKRLPDAVKRLEANKVFIISGPHLYKCGAVSKCLDTLKEHGIPSDFFTDTEANPGTDTVEKATKCLKAVAQTA